MNAEKQLYFQVKIWLFFLESAVASNFVIGYSLFCRRAYSWRHYYRFCNVWLLTEIKKFLLIKAWICLSSNVKLNIVKTTRRSGILKHKQLTVFNLNFEEKMKKVRILDSDFITESLRFPDLPVLSRTSFISIRFNFVSFCLCRLHTNPFFLGF